MYALLSKVHGNFRRGRNLIDCKSAEGEASAAGIPDKRVPTTLFPTPRHRSLLYKIKSRACGTQHNAAWKSTLAEGFM